MSGPFAAFSRPDVVVIGAGPAGMAAALAAADQGAQVLVFEQMAVPGAKLAVSGGGRCNLTTTEPPDAICDRFGPGGRFMMPALTAFGPDRLRAWLAGLGVATHAPDGLGVWPADGDGDNVRNALWERLKALLGVTIRLGARVTGIQVDDHHISGLTTDAGHHLVRRVILATGGKSHPELGANGSGYALAAQAGHGIVDPRPALVPLVAQEAWLKSCAGASLRPGRVWVEEPGQARAGLTGDVLFTKTGLSGPAVLDLSGTVAGLLARQTAVELRLSLAPEMDLEAWIRQFREWDATDPRKALTTLLDRHLPASVAKAAATLAGLEPGATPSQVSAEARQKLAQVLTAAPVTVVATEGFARAMVTRGGVSLKQVDPKTLASRLIDGLYFAGETLDLDGPCGGYNHTWAFASGHLAGTAAGRVP